MIKINPKEEEILRQAEEIKRKQRVEMAQRILQEEQAAATPGYVPPPPAAETRPIQPGQLKDYVPKSIAAREVYKHLKVNKLTSIMAVCSFFVILLVGVFNQMAGVGAAVLATAAIAYFLYRTQNEMKRLEQLYRIDAKTGQ